MINICIIFEKYHLKSIVLLVQFNQCIFYEMNFFRVQPCNRMSYAEKKHQDIYAFKCFYFMI